MADTLEPMLLTEIEQKLLEALEEAKALRDEKPGSDTLRPIR